MRKDFLGNEVTVPTDEVMQGVDDFVHGFLAYETTTPNILAAADAAPDCCLANAYAAYLWMLLEAPEAPDKAATYVARALDAAPHASPREAAAAKIAAAWADGDIPRVLALCDDTVRACPRDLVSTKLAQYHAFNYGDAPNMLRFAMHSYEACKDVPHMHGMTAFAFEQCHLIPEAEEAARQAIAMKRKEPWAQHALAHVMLTQARIEEGLSFMEDMSDTWTGLNSFMSTHNWWHLALFYISRGRMDDALSLYDGNIWGVAKDYSQDQVGAISLLVRLELAGVDVGDRWADLTPYIARRGADTVQPFLTLQYLYALARSGRPEAAHLMDAVRRRADTAASHDTTAWRDVALPAADGLLAHAREDYETAIVQLGAALPRMADIGGSHAQRDLFEQIHLDAVIKSGRLVRAQQTLEQRRAYDPDGTPLNLQLAEVYDRLDLPQQAAMARDRAAK